MAAIESAVSGEKTSPPYLPHRTLINFVNSLAQGIPARIDRSVISNMPGATQTQLLYTLRYFGLTESDGSPKEDLTRLVNSEGMDRKKELREIVLRSYSFVFKSPLDLQKATTRMIEELFDAQGVQGDTRRKAMGLFLALAKDAEIKLSPHIKAPKTVTGSGGRRRTPRGAGVVPEEVNDEAKITNPPPPPANGMSKTIQLKSGGQLTLSISVDLFELSDEDRDFVFGLISSIKAHERGNG